MTSRERLIAAARGGEVDQKPILAWPKGAAESDTYVVSGRMPRPSHPDNEQRIVLAEISNPFGLALSREIDLNSALSDNPVEGSRILDGLVEETRTAMEGALSADADGVLYRLHGASPAHCSPMQYGGFYLERDRELLGAIAGAFFNVLFVIGDEEVYLDFVSDLPAHVFAWDNRTTGVSSAAVREMRPGAQASMDPLSEIFLLTDLPSIAKALENRDFAAV